MATRRGAGTGKAASAPARKAAKALPARALRSAPRREFRDEVVLAKTGRTRADWFAVLDAFDGRAQGHKASAAHLMGAHGVAPWWAQAITVEYERSRGIRSYGERADGFACSVQRALAVPAGRAWDAFADPGEVDLWTASGHRHNFREGCRWRDAAGGRGVFERIVRARFVRFTWNHPERAPGSFVDVEFLVRGEDRSIVKVTHRWIRSAEEREDLRLHWSWALDSMKSFVETGAPIAREDWVSSR